MATLKYSPTGELLFLESSPKEEVIEGNWWFSKRVCLFHDHITGNIDTTNILKMFGASVTNEGYESQTIAEDINPYICWINYQLVVYFGDDKPVLKSKSVKTCTPGYKKWTGYNWKNPKKIETYYYLVVDEPEKMFIFNGNTYHFDRCTAQNKHETLEVEGQQYICRYDMPQKEWEKHMQVKIQKDKEEKKRRKEYAEALQKRKETPGYCSRCGAEHARLTVNPFNAEMNGDYTPEWLCCMCYDSLLGDI